MTSVRGSLADLPTVARAWRLRDDRDAAEHQLALADLGISGQSRELVDEVLLRRVVVLLGEPGFGKSRELDRMAARASDRETACQRVNLGGYGENQLLAELNRGAVQAAKQDTDALLLLDGFEESRLGIRHVSELLARAIQELPPRVHVLLTCRTAAWPAALERELRSEAPDLSVVELLPLTRQQVDYLARKAGLDPISFRQMVADAGVEDLTRTPMLLRLLLREALKNGPDGPRLPSTRAELFNKKMVWR